MTENGKISARKRLNTIRCVRQVLSRLRGLGLTGPGQALAGLPPDFTIFPEDVPDEPEDTEAGKDLVRRLITRVKADLDDLSTEERTQIEQAISVVRKTRTVMLGMPRVGQPLPDVRSRRSA
ncbi:hypothetical protein [Streptomyces atratus]|uniref:hypothetical protein n=1 Tax=Streptomyces atratus TaxID=1893 RepID=UPI0037A3EE24